MKTLFLLAITLSLALRAVSQTQSPATPVPPALAADGSIRQIVGIGTIPILTCRLVSTRTILGYVPGTSIPVYQNTCTGLCLSLITQPTVCTPKYLYRKLSRFPILIDSLTSPLLSNARNLTSQTPVDSLLADISPIPSLWWTITVRQVVGCSCQPAPCKVVVDGVTHTYQSGQTAYDACDRKCTCSYGKLINCCRQRKEWRLGMTQAERLRYINAYKTISTTLPYKPVFDAFVLKHQTLFGSGIHGNNMFFPWHRAYIWELEDMLRQVDCRVTQPYWKWSLEAANPFGSTLFNNVDGFGGAGSSPNYCVPLGPFSLPWLTTQGVCLRRQWTGTPTLGTVANINQILNVNCPNAADFTCMRQQVESYHNQVHVVIGGGSGHMSSGGSTNDPVFFQHHCYIDAIWAQWQAKSPAHVLAYGGGNTATVLPGSPTTVANWLDLNNQNGINNKVCYIDPPNWWWLDFVFTAERAAQIPRLAVQPFPELWLRNMQMSQDAIRQARIAWDAANDPATQPIIPEALRASAGPLGVFLADSDFSDLAKAGGVVNEGCVDPKSDGEEPVQVELDPGQFECLSLQCPTDRASDASPTRTPAAQLPLTDSDTQSP